MTLSVSTKECEYWEWASLLHCWNIIVSWVYEIKDMKTLFGLIQCFQVMESLVKKSLMFWCKHYTTQYFLVPWISCFIVTYQDLNRLRRKSKDSLDLDYYHSLLKSFSAHIIGAKTHYFLNKIYSASDLHKLVSTFSTLLNLPPLTPTNAFSPPQRNFLKWPTCLRDQDQTPELAEKILHPLDPAFHSSLIPSSPCPAWLCPPA